MTEIDCLWRILVGMYCTPPLPLFVLLEYLTFEREGRFTWRGIAECAVMASLWPLTSSYLVITFGFAVMNSELWKTQANQPLGDKNNGPHESH